ncbi:35283_t:CDS:2, partial [Gigaspora margarita]
LNGAVRDKEYRSRYFYYQLIIGDNEVLFPLHDIEHLYSSMGILQPILDKAYHRFYKALGRFAGDPNTAKEVCDVSNALIKGRRVSKNCGIDDGFGIRAAIQAADKLRSGTKVLGEKGKPNNEENMCGTIETPW